MEKIIYEKNIQSININSVEENIKYINNLKYLKNKSIIIQKYNPKFSIGISEKLLINELEKKNIYYTIDEFGYSMRIFLKDNSVHFIQGINYGLNNTGTSKILMDKIRTNDILYEDGFKIPEYVTLYKKDSKFLSSNHSIDKVKKMGEKLGYPLIAKPHNGENSYGIVIINNENELLKFYDDYNNGLYQREGIDPIAIVQKLVKGNEIRVIYLDGEILLAYKKNICSIIGDGSSNILQLLQKKNLSVQLYSQAVSSLEKKGIMSDHILLHSDKLEVFDYINESSDLDTEISFSNSDVNLVNEIAKSFGARYFGLDIITSSDIKDGYIIEINGKPDVLWARKISESFKNKFWKRLADIFSGDEFEKITELEYNTTIIKKDTGILDCGLTHDEYMQKTQNLHFLENKNEIIESKNTIKHGIFLLIDKMEEEGVSYRIDSYGFIASIKMANGTRKLVYSGDYGFNNSTHRRIFEDKIYTSKILRNSGVKVARDMIVIKEKSGYSDDSNNTKSCLFFAYECGYPLIFKPNDGSLGAGVKKIFNEVQLMDELRKYNNNTKSGLFLLQEYLPGKDYRIIYLDGNILVSYERIPPKVIGDGVNTIEQLILLNKYDDIIDNVKIFLQDQNINIFEVLEINKEINLLPTANIATKGIVKENLTDEEDRLFIDSIAKTFGSCYFGIDVISNGKISEGYILEINNAPITKGITAASSLFKEKFIEIIWNKIKE